MCLSLWITRHLAETCAAPRQENDQKFDRLVIFGTQTPENTGKTGSRKKIELFLKKALADPGTNS